MITLSSENVTDLVFYDKKVQQILPELSEIFHKWTLGIRAGLNSIAKDALLDFLNTITSEQLDKLAGYWGSPVQVRRLDSSIVRNYTFPIGEVEKYFNDIGDWNICVAREGDILYLSTWR